jgi:hypothetical protein
VQDISSCRCAPDKRKCSVVCVCLLLRGVCLPPSMSALLPYVGSQRCGRTQKGIYACGLGTLCRPITQVFPDITSSIRGLGGMMSCFWRSQGCTTHCQDIPLSLAFTFLVRPHGTAPASSIGSMFLCEPVTQQVKGPVWLLPHCRISCPGLNPHTLSTNVLSRRTLI